MGDPLVEGLLLAAVVTVALVLRERAGLRRAAGVQARLRGAAAPEPLPVHPRPRPLLTDPDHADGWLLATPDGRCTAISRGARAAFGIVEPGADGCTLLSSLIRNGESEATAILNELTLRSLLSSRCVWPATIPSQPLELAGVALRDRGGNLWGAALLIRAAPVGSPPAPPARQ